MSATTKKTIIACLLNRKEMVRATADLLANYKRVGGLDEKIRVTTIRMETFEQQVKDLEELLTQTKGT